MGDILGRSPVDPRLASMVDVSSESKTRAAMRQEGCREEFASLYSAHELQLFSYILALTGNLSAAEDVFQETCVVMWQKFSDFEVGTNFAAWARKIAYHMVMRYHRQAGRKHVFLCDAFVETMSAVRSSRTITRDSRSEALQKCLAKLRPRDRELLACRIRKYGFAAPADAGPGATSSLPGRNSVR